MQFFLLPFPLILLCWVLPFLFLSMEAQWYLFLVLFLLFYKFLTFFFQRVPVGHNGRPAKDVILKLRREGVSTQQEKRKNRFVLEGAEQKQVCLSFKKTTKRKGFNFFFFFFFFSLQAPQCSYYVKGELITTGCVTLDYNEEFVNCSFVFIFDFSPFYL